MPGFECLAEVDIPDDFVCDETDKCKGYQPVEVKVCPRHNEEYTDFCVKCEDELEESR